jgi:hypothetical protein
MKKWLPYLVLAVSLTWLCWQVVAHLDTFRNVQQRVNTLDQAVDQLRGQ